MDSDHGSGSSKHSRTRLHDGNDRGSSRHSGIHLEFGDGSGSSRHSRTLSEVADGTGSSGHSRSHTEVGDGSESSRHSRSHQEVDDGSGSSRHSRSHQEVSDGRGSSGHSGTYLHSDGGSGSSKHSTAHPETLNENGSNNIWESHLDGYDGNGSSKHSERHLEDIDRETSSNHFEIDSDIVHGFGSSNHYDICPEIFDAFFSNGGFEMEPTVLDRTESSETSETHQEVVDRSDSYEQTLPPPAFVNEADLLFPTKKLEPSSSSSSSSSASSSKDLFQVDTKKDAESTARITSSLKSPEVTQPTVSQVDALNNNSLKSDEHHNIPPPTSTSQFSDPAHEPLVHNMSPTQSPPIQMMDRSGGYDPNRIPSSIFNRSKSATPMEWSAASNDSLFSIHVGNNSFSRDQFLVMGGDLSKSGELRKSSELIVFSPPPPFHETDKKSVEIENCQRAKVADETTKDTKIATTEDRIEKKTPPPPVSWNSSTISNHSDGSGASIHSFAFPIKKKRACPSCYCSNCSWAFCYCTWPSCYCCNCSWAFCYDWNCSYKRWCYSSNALTEGTKSSSLKSDVEKEILKPPATEVTKKTASRSCFSCFPSCRCHFPSCQCFSCRSSCC